MLALDGVDDLLPRAALGRLEGVPDLELLAEAVIPRCSCLNRGDAIAWPLNGVSVTALEGVPAHDMRIFAQLDQNL